MEVKAMKRSVDFMPQIEGLRFVAVLGVMIFHWVATDFSNSFIFSNIPFGTGVNLFFVISGFLITFILLKKKDDIHEKKISFAEGLKNFYIKRTLRIFPVYYLLIIGLCIFSYSTIKDFLAYMLTYTTNWYIVFKNAYIGSETPLWSLAVEEQFYLIWPFFIFIIPKKWILHFISFSIIVGVLSKIYFGCFTPYGLGVNAATFSCFDSLGLGALIAYIQMKRILPFKTGLYKLCLVVSVIAYILLFINPGYLNPGLKSLLSNFATSVVFFFIVIIAANNGFKRGFKFFLESKSAQYLGRISYGLYLYHSFAMEIYCNSGLIVYFKNLRGDADLFIMFFLLTVILATISWYLIEKPLLSLKQYFQ
ncbi:MAG: acyltransferase family protein [Bacteroidia bacterium]